MDSNWVRGKKLGNGSFATVSIAENKCDGSLMAAKSCGALHSSSLYREKLILQELKDCPEIIQCYGDSYSFENGERLYNVLLEFASGGSLSEKVKNSGDHRLPEFEVRRYTKSLLKGLKYIHEAGYVHCDVKLQNILLDQSNGLKIADFGLAKRVGSKDVGFENCEFRGTPLYMSPETVNGVDHGPPADIWAVGCAVVEMITGRSAWKYTSDLAELLMRIGVGDEVPEIPSWLSELGKDFLERCFVKDPIKRWTAEMLLDHSFVCDDQDSDDMLKENSVSASPRCPFDWVSEATCSITSLPSLQYTREPSLWLCDVPEFKREPWCSPPGERLRGLVSDQGPNWSVSNDWVTIR